MANIYKPDLNTAYSPMDFDEIAAYVDRAPDTKHALWRIASVLRVTGDDKTMHTLMCVLAGFIRVRSKHEAVLVDTIRGAASWPYNKIDVARNIYTPMRGIETPSVVNDWLIREEAPKFALYLLALALRDLGRHQRDELDSMITLLLS